MRFKWLNWKAAAAVAFLMGLAMVEQARADWLTFDSGGNSWD